MVFYILREIQIKQTSVFFQAKKLKIILLSNFLYAWLHHFLLDTSRNATRIIILNALIRKRNIFPNTQFLPFENNIQRSMNNIVVC